ncbi:MAG: adenylate/guanylate cyclase domain-containing protein, partial [Pseudomonadota bacterium]
MKRSFSISTLLPLILSVLVFGAVVPVIAVTYFINAANTNALLSARAELIVDELENQIIGLLEPVEELMTSAKVHIEEQPLGYRESTDFETYAEGLLDAMPQLSGIGVIRPDGSMRRWQKGRVGAIEEPATSLPLVDQVLAEADLTDQPTWSAPFVSLVIEDTILNPRISIRRDGQLQGVVAAGVTGSRLSRYVTELADEVTTPFILYDRDKLIAYPNRKNEVTAPTSTALPEVGDSDLEIIREIWSNENELTRTTRMQRTQGHWSNIGGVNHAFFYREVTGYSPEPLLVGVALPSSESRFFRLAAMLAVGLGITLLIAAVLVSIFLGRRIAAPVVDMGDALQKMERMEFDRVQLPSLAESRIAEWRNSAKRITATARALASFNQYVPGTLARRLMRRPQDAASASERVVTVMFIDMEGFSEFARSHTAKEAADVLNRVFGLIGPVIEAHGGVIDKYTGDGLMAFWGAPDDQPDHEL